MCLWQTVLVHAPSQPLFMERVRPPAHEFRRTTAGVCDHDAWACAQRQRRSATALRHDARRQRPTHFHEGALTNGGRQPGGGSPTHMSPCADSHCHDSGAWGEAPAWRRIALQAASARRPLPAAPSACRRAARARAPTRRARDVASAQPLRPRHRPGAAAGGPPRRPRWRR